LAANWPQADSGIPGVEAAQYVSRVGQKQDALARLLSCAGLDLCGSVSPFALSDQPADRRAIARRIFLALGGREERFDLYDGPGAWDIATTEGVFVELDEEQHFNRYRLTTLTFLDSIQIPWTATYRGYCSTKEGKCRTDGSFWTRASCEQVFGPSDPPGVFDGGGSARWKQRAFNDVLKDIHPRVRLARVSIYDEIEGRALKSILRAVDTGWSERVRAFTFSRLNGEKASSAVPQGLGV
jgi:hypothetical protein